MPLTPEQILQTLHAALATSEAGASPLTLHPGQPDPWIEVPADLLLSVCRLLRSHTELQFDILNNLCGVDTLETDPKRAPKAAYPAEIQVVYHLTSFVHRHRITIKVRLLRWKDGVAGQLPELPSVSSLWSIANWHERECYDLVGVQFSGHPDLTRILCPDDWVGHPLRKDYEMPLEYGGIRAR